MNSKGISQQRALLACPACRSTSFDFSSARAVCVSCGASYPAIDGIIDFDLGDVATQLDDLDYDAFYQIDESRSRRAFDHVLAAHRDVFPDQIVSLFEIGTGTGGFTFGMLDRLSVEHVVLSDVSQKMLQICLARLRDHGLSERSDVHCVTYSGRNSCFADDSFDLCIGSAVLHHILDVETCLRDVYKALKPGGRALFIEPNRRYHQAAIATLTDLLTARLGKSDAATSVTDAALLSWIAENQYNIVHRGDEDMLRHREDKHQFDQEGIAAISQRIGFSAVELRPLDPGNLGMGALRFVFEQIGLDAPTTDAVLADCAVIAPRYFDLLTPQDATPAYLIVCEKDGGVAGRATPVAVVPKPRLPQAFRYELFLDVTAVDGGLLLRGWCACTEPLRRIILATPDGQASLPIWLPRPDIYRKFRDDPRMPVYSSLFSGIEETIPFTRPNQGRVEGLAIVLELADGRIVPLGDFPAGGETAVFYRQPDG